MKLNYYLSLAALIPAAILFVRIYQLDHIEKEPRLLLGKLVLFGALAAVPAALAQLLLTRAAGAALGRSTVWYLLLDNFVIVACSEELAKLLPVRLAAWDHPAFDYRFDAIVYSVSSALGFAAVENILYVLQSDLRTAVSRAILSVPGHFFLRREHGAAAQPGQAGRMLRAAAAQAGAGTAGAGGPDAAARALGFPARGGQPLGCDRVLRLCGRVFHHGGRLSAPRLADGQPAVKFGCPERMPFRNCRTKNR